MTQKTIFSQNQTSLQVASIVSGSADSSLSSALVAVLYSHTSTAVPLLEGSADPSAETGFSGQAAQLLSVDPDEAGATSAEVGSDGELGILINSVDLIQSGTVPDGPMPFLLQWLSPSPQPLFTPSITSVQASLDLQVPYVEAAGYSDQSSSSQIVLYLGLIDRSTGKSLAFGLTLFDSRGSSNPYLGLDTGSGGTGAAVVTKPAGSDSTETVTGAAGFQGASWSGMKHFAFQIDAADLSAAIASANRIESTSDRLSTVLSNYVLQNVSLDAEVEYFGQSEAFGYSVANFSLVDNPNSTTTTIGATGSVDGTSNSSNTTMNVASNLLPETITASAGHSYDVQGGAGTLVFIGNDEPATVLAGLGATTIAGGAGAITVYGSYGRLLAYGGSGGGSVIYAGSGNSTLVGAHDDVLSAGGGNALLFSGTGSNTVYGGSTDAAIATIVATSGNDIIVAGRGATTIYTGSGNDTVWGSSDVASQTEEVGGSGSSVLTGGSGTDTIWGGIGASTLIGGSGSEVLAASASTSLVVAGPGADTLYGGVGAAKLVLGAGVDLVSLSQAGIGADTVSVGVGQAYVWAGAAPDVYDFSSAAPTSRVVVTGFRPGVDSLVGSTVDSNFQAAGNTVLSLSNGATVALVGLHSWQS